MRAHLDGARLMNAVVASGVPARDWAGGFDTAWLDFTKGLGAPVGAVLAGSRELIDEAWRYKQMWGGAMRQAGIVAAAGLTRSTTTSSGWPTTTRTRASLAEGLAELDGVELDPARSRPTSSCSTCPTPRRSAPALERAGVLMYAIGPRRVRAVTHLDVDRAGIEQAIAAAGSALGSGRSVTAQ